MQTTDAALLDALERIAVAQMVMAVVLAVIGLIAIGAAGVVLLEFRAARRLVHNTLDELKPRLAPLIDRAKSVTDDVAGMTDDVRRRVDGILHTVEDLHQVLQRGGAAAEQRIRRFDAVLEMVQTEAEELLLDAAATAHGVHETARVLREPAPGRRQRAVHDDQGDEEVS